MSQPLPEPSKRVVPEYARNPVSDGEWEKAIEFHSRFIVKQVSKVIVPEDRDEVITLVKAKIWMKRKMYSPDKGAMTTWIGWQIRAMIKDHTMRNTRSQRAGITFSPLTELSALNEMPELMEDAAESALYLHSLGIPHPLIKAFLPENLL